MHTTLPWDVSKPVFPESRRSRLNSSCPPSRPETLALISPLDGFDLFPIHRTRQPAVAATPSPAGHDLTECTGVVIEIRRRGPGHHTTQIWLEDQIRTDSHQHPFNAPPMSKEYESVLVRCQRREPGVGRRQRPRTALTVCINGFRSATNSPHRLRPERRSLQPHLRTRPSATKIHSRLLTGSISTSMFMRSISHSRF